MRLKTFHEINKAEGCYIIAEAGLNHNGSINIAKKLIDIASATGADAVKFQKRTIDILAVKEILDANDDRFPEFGSTYREIRQHLEFNMDEFYELKSYSEEKGLDFICTAFDIPAVDFLQELELDIYKLASHSLTNIPLLEYLAEIRKPVILSTGMANFDDIDHAVEIFSKNKSSLALLHCVSAYPTPINDSNLSMINVLKKRYGLLTGYSGHELGFLPTVSAVVMGAKIVERHYTLDRKMTGFDHRISLEPEELTQMIKDIRAVPGMQGMGQKSVSETEMITRNKYHVSIVSAVPISSGTVLTEAMITYRNPGTGIPPKSADTVLGHIAKCDIPEDILIEPDMFE